MRLQRFWHLLVLSLVINLSACIVLPIGGADEDLFEEEQLSFIEIGRSTKEEIATVMSNFPMDNDDDELSVSLRPTQFRGGDWWLYAQERQELEWGLFVDGYRGDPKIIGGVDYRFLLIKFDNNGVVTGYELSSSESWGCNKSGFCVGGLRYNLLAPEEEDRVVKQFDIPADRCGIYMYGKPRSEARIESRTDIWLDGQKVGWLLDKKQFFFWQLDQGVHQLVAYSPNYSEQRPIEFSCAAGGSYFFELKQKESGFFRKSFWIEIEQRDAVKGREAIGNRQLTLNITKSSH